MQVDRADEIITNLLDFSRVKPPAKGLVPVDLLIKKALEDFTIPSNISVEIDIPQKIDAPFLDSTQIHHVLLNVIINAVQAISGKGKIIINVRQKENNILISISDTGCGIPQENLNKLFEPLFTTKAKGIGLGLAVSKSLVDANNGQISFESEPGAGTTVHLTFPTREV
jgi:signal transduction histidine kinase